jgi:SAM-dependent methyltransferase
MPSYADPTPRPAATITWRRRLWYAFIRARLPFKRPLVKGYLRLLERKRSRRGDIADEPPVEGIPVPPARLRVLVNGIPDLGWFLASGRAQTNYLRDLLSEAGHPPEEMSAILEFGCGCGRMTRWWAAGAGPQIYACDYNRELVDWCRENLPFVKATTNSLEPPLPFPAETFDFVYAFSVFTHLSVQLARSWLSELRRVTRPGALVWLTVHGQTYRERLPAEQRRQFDAGEIVVWFPEIEGTNLCAAYWPEAAVAGMLGSDFVVLDHLDPLSSPGKAHGAQVAPHDAYLLRRT